MKNIVIAIIVAFIAIAPASAQYRKAVSILGDSYSTYEGYITPATNEPWYTVKMSKETNDVKDVRQTWWHQFISDKGYRLCVNNSYSGATISYTGYHDEDYSPRSFCTRLDNLGCPDIILVFGATNDSWAGSPIGEYKYEKWKRADMFTFRPAMAYLLEHLIIRYPNVEIYFILNDDLKDEIDESVKTVCAHYSIPVIELKGIDKQSGHPSIKGMRQIADQLEKAIK